MPFNHAALDLRESKELVYTAMSKHLFYYRMHISKFVLDAGKVPLNPFMLFDYFLLDSVDRDKVREANNALVTRADAIWVFGAISNGVLAEIQIAKDLNKPLRYFTLAKPHAIVEAVPDDVEMESEVAAYRQLL